VYLTLPSSFLASRIEKPAGLNSLGLNYGTLPIGVNYKAIIEWAKPFLTGSIS
jgi:hypothetical protein